MRAFVVGLCLLALAACEEQSSKPYLEFAGGGFVFNYRTGDAFYGFVAKPARPLPEGALIEARLEMPGWAAPLVLQESARPGKLQYSFKTPDLDGIEAGHAYAVTLLVFDAPGGKELARYQRSFQTDVDQASLPKEGLVVGPAYQPNPNADP